MSREMERVAAMSREIAKSLGKIADALGKMAETQGGCRHKRLTVADEMTICVDCRVILHFGD